MSDDHAIKLTLFRDERAKVCGWFIGPVVLTPDRVSMPYLPRSECALASVATVRAMMEAERIDAPLWIIDPEDLWEPAWDSRAA